MPEEYRTAVVIPILFASVEAVREALDNLEVQFLANRAAHLHFAVLSDFTDSPTETTRGDAAILAAAVEGVHALNARYAAGPTTPSISSTVPGDGIRRQGVWMGWERKRGKLAEFNRFVRGGEDDAFSTIVGDVDPLRVRYVITLDADTVLPPDAAPLLVGTLAHPLNRAVHDPVARTSDPRLRDPPAPRRRVAPERESLDLRRDPLRASGCGSLYDRGLGRVSGPLRRGELHREGDLRRRGVRAGHAGRFPENTLLSHDLIEGSYARAGLATDIMVYDDYPTRYLTFTRRKHRWIRGDWQLLDWLSSRVPGPDGPERNRLSLLSRWKILDNLRRSVVEIAQLVFLVAGWTVLPGSPLRWTGLGLLAIAAHWIVSLLLALVRPPLDKSWRAYYATVGLDAMTSVQQIALAVAFLPHQAWVSADAIVRTLWRLFVTKRYLLEWQTASQTERMSGSRGATWRTMWPAVALTAGILGLVIAVRWGTVEGRRRGISCWPSHHSSWCGCFRPPSRTRTTPHRCGGSADPLVASGRRASLRAPALDLLRSPRDRRDQLSRPG